MKQAESSRSRERLKVEKMEKELGMPHHRICFPSSCLPDEKICYLCPVCKRGGVQGRRGCAVTGQSICCSCRPTFEPCFEQHIFVLQEDAGPPVYISENSSHLKPVLVSSSPSSSSPVCTIFCCAELAYLD